MDKTILPDIHNKIAELKKEMGIWGKERRIEYLMERRQELECKLIDLESEYHRKKERDTPYIERGVLTKTILQTRKEIEKIKRECGGIVKGNSKITDEDIARAKEYPVESLIEVKRGMARCVSGIHEDKNPSMGCKNNRVRCFSCGYTGSAIDIAMKLNNLNFIEAVKFLNGR